MKYRCSKLLLLSLLLISISTGWTSSNTELEGIYVVNETSMISGGFYNVVPTAYVLFKNGIITSRFLEPPEEMNIADLSKKELKHWGKWEKTGNKITIKWNDGDTDEWEKWYIGEPAKAGELISGKFYRVSGGGNFALGGTITYGTIKDISFNNKGQFTTVKTSQAVFPSSEIFEHVSKSGKYSLNGHAIELNYNNGKKERRAFFLSR